MIHVSDLGNWAVVRFTVLIFQVKHYVIHP